MENWKAIIGYEGLYEVSDKGRIRSLDRLCKAKLGSHRPHKGRVINGGVNSRGYRICLLYSSDGKRTTAYVHRLVLSAFVGEPKEKHETCHNDGNKLNNSLDNLRWDTHVSNCEDREEHGTNHKGENNGNSKLTVEKVLAIRADTRKRKEIAKEYNVSLSLIGFVKARTIWKHI